MNGFYFYDLIFYDLFSTKLKKLFCLGAVHFSINSRYEEQVSQWTSIAEVPCTNIEHWHKLLQVENSSLTNLLYENRK